MRTGRADAAGVQLLTLDASKGLEFAPVGVLGCEFAGKTRAATGRRGSAAGEDEAFEVPSPDAWEERRLLYVGMTRARDHLALFRVGERQASEWPDFLAPLPSDFALASNEAARG